MVEPTGVKRKLAVILAADAEGFTRLIREAEEPTLETLTEYRVIIDGLIGRHDGRIFGTAGDSVVAEFRSAAGGKMVISEGISVYPRFADKGYQMIVAANF